MANTMNEHKPCLSEEERKRLQELYTETMDRLHGFRWFQAEYNGDTSEQPDANDRVQVNVRRRYQIEHTSD